MTEDVPSATWSARARAIAGRVALVVGGVVAALLLVEGGLQIGALVVRATARQMSGDWLTPRRRVVAIGDSNTYGLRVERAQAYPMVLERLWNETPGVPPIEVLNLGYPGTNSAAARNIVHHAIAAVHPALITVMVGGNDWWTEVRPPDPLDWRVALSNWLWRHSRAYRLFFMLRRAGRTSMVEISDEWGTDLSAGGARLRIGDASVAVEYRMRKGSEGDEWEPMFENLRAIVAECRQAGVAVVFLTYPGNDVIYNVASQLLRQIAREHGVPLIDVAKDIHPVCPKGVCDLLQRDQHPTVLGHERTAEIVRDGLRASGVLDGPATP